MTVPGVRTRERAQQAPRTGASLVLRGVGATLGGRRVLRDVDVEVEPRSWIAVVGPNGAGKSTLLRAVAGLVRHEGTVLLDGADARRLSPRARAMQVAYAPQVPVLPDGVRVEEYVLLGRTPHRSLLSGPGARDRTVVSEVLERLDLAPFTGRLLRTLSGGERQRAVLARALAQQPRLLLLDEPTAALDLGHAQQVLDLVDRLRREDGLTVVSTLHDLALAGQYPDRVLLLADGVPRAEGPPEEVLTAAALHEHYAARADVRPSPQGVRVHPLRAPQAMTSDGRDA